MKKVIPILVITVWLMQAVTINVNAAPFVIREKLQTPPPVVDLSDVPQVLIWNADVPTQDGAKDYTVTGDGTEQVIVEGTAVSHCREFFGTYFCTNSDMNVSVVNNNGEALTLNACAVITIEDGPGVAKFFWDDEGPGGFGANAAVPFADCVQYDMDIDETFVVGLRAAATGNTDTIFTYHYVLYLSYSPISTCQVEPVSLTSDTFEIDPLLETPLGPTGTPADDQIYTTITGEPYHITTAGTWDDGTVATREDAAISWDGITWTPLISVPSICVESNGNDASRYITAESETLHIRSNDTTAEFGDNSANDPPYTYTIEQVYMGVDCEAQYTYSEADNIGDVTVPGNSEIGVLVSDALVVGEWYAITVVSGTWQDDGSPPDRTDMELRVDGDAQYNEDPVYHDFSSGGGGVGCQSTDETTWYIQAQNIELHLRVNNETGTFTSNTGALEVSVYHAAYERGLEACEVKYELGGLQDYQSVSANAENGKMFGLWTGPQTTTSPLGVATAGSLVPGAWYVIDIIDGPWSQNGSGLLGANAHPATAFYDMAVSTNRSTWFPLAEWSLPDCNVEYDALGHRRIYFQTPSDDGFEWYFRVNDQDDSWNGNAGSLGWNLYRTTNTEAVPPGVDPWASCGDDYGHRLLYNSGTTIPVQEEEGTYLRQALLGTAGSSQDEIIADAGSSMSIGDVFKVTIKQGPWLDGDVEHFDAAISSDDGVTWYPMSDDSNPALDCVSVDQAGKYYSVTFTVAASQRWKIRVNDDTGDFIGNTGNLAYVMYKLTNNSAEGLGSAGSGTLNDAAGLGIASGGVAVCVKPLMYPQYVAPTGIYTQPDQPEGTDVWEWVQWVGQSFYQTSVSFFGYLFDLIGAVFRYTVGWINYGILATQKFFAFCPKDVGTLMNAINVLKTKEPLASIYEVITIVTDTREKLESYDWGDYQNTSLFSMDGLSDVQAMIEENILRRDGTVIDPWDGGAVVSFDNSGLPASYYSCGSAFTDYLPTRLRSSVCFVMAYFKETGAMFWVQLLVIDIGALSIMVMSIKRALQELIYMMTGVKPWTKSGVNASVDKLAAYMEKRDRESDVDRELDRRFGRNRTARDWRYR